MEDKAFVANRTNSALVFSVEKIHSRVETWKCVYGALKACVDFNAANDAKLFNELAKKDFTLLCSEMSYFDNVKEDLAENCTKVDVSCNMSNSHMETIIKYSFQKVSVASVEEMEAWSTKGYNGEFILRISSTDALQDCGCEAEEVVSILREAAQKGFKVTSLHFTCLAFEKTPYRVKDRSIDFGLETRKRASSTLSAMQKVTSAMESSNLLPLPILITGEGMPSLALQKDEPDAEKILSTLKDLSLRVPITIDGSRFFLDSACSIYCRVTGKKHQKNEKGERFLYYLNNGVYCSFFNAHIRQETLNPQPIIVVPKEGGRSDKTYTTTVFGPTCDSIDTLGVDFILPELDEGDWLKFDGNGYRCGNYSPMFNSFEDPDILVI